MQSMCHYCGCREMPLLRDYIAEHGQALEHADRMLRAIDRGDHASAQQDLDAFTGILAAHWKGEEDGLFAVLQLDSAYAAHITPLVAEHRELAALLAMNGTSRSLPGRRRIRGRVCG